jgi:hypothetical protein
MKQPLIRRLYWERPLWEAARIIGYGGCGDTEFWDQVKATGLDKEIDKHSNTSPQATRSRFMPRPP